MDFMAIDTLFGKRFYLLLIMELKTRRIVRYDLTENPCREFVKQRIALFSEKQVRKIVKEYVVYYNNQRPHQAINRIPAADIKSSIGSIKKQQILGGLHSHYYRSSA